MIGVRLPANHDEIAGEVAQQNVVLDLRVRWGGLALAAEQTLTY